MKVDLASLVQQGLAALKASRPGEALRYFDQAVESQPQHAGLRHLQAMALATDGDLLRAKDSIKQAIALDGASAQYYLMLGTIEHEIGELHAALTALDTAVGMDKNLIPAWYQKGLIYLDEDRAEDATNCFDQVIALDQNHFKSLHQLAMINYRHGKHDDAAHLLRKVIAQAPDFVPALNNLSMVCYFTGSYEEARKYADEACQLDAHNTNARFNRGLASRALGNLAEAIADFDVALHSDPLRIDIQVEKAAALQASGKWDEAEILYKQVLQNNPEDINGTAAYAELLEWRGQYDQALDLIESLDHPVDARLALTAARILHRLKRPQDGLHQLAPWLSGTTEQNHALQNRIWFAAGDLEDAAGKYDQAFEYYCIANKNSSRSFDAEQHSELINRIINAGVSGVTTENSPSTGVRKIFIVGMPRSGTSLLEQLLNQHPDILACGERAEIGQIVSQMQVQIDADTFFFPEAVALLNVEQCSSLASFYTDAVTGGGDIDSLWMSDKMPLNFLYLNLIKRLFPDCRIVHCDRNPDDIAISCYFQNFIDPALNFSFDPAHIRAYLKDYQRLMDHWQRHLNVPIMSIKYEDLVKNPQDQMSALFAWLELDSIDLNYTHTVDEKIINTASFAQVREPIHQDSVGRFEHYRRFFEASFGE